MEAIVLGRFARWSDLSDCSGLRGISVAHRACRGMLLQLTWEQVEPCDLHRVGVATELSGLCFFWRRGQLWVTLGAQWREKGHCGQCFPTCQLSLLCPSGYVCTDDCQLSSWELEEIRQSVGRCRLHGVMTCNHHGPVHHRWLPLLSGWFPPLALIPFVIPLRVWAATPHIHKLHSALKMPNDRRGDLWDSSAVTVIWLYFSHALPDTLCYSL